jgi:MFS-type transporter involved in bile tolerance (Atg22 family)
MPLEGEPPAMSARTIVDFYRSYWLSLTLCLGIMGLYLLSALAHADYWYALAGVLAVVAAVGWLWRRYEP